MPNQVVHFEIPADDVERAIAFYKDIFGWKIKQFPMPPGSEYWGVTAKKDNEPGINGGLMQRKMPGQPFMNYIGVASIDAAHEKIQAKGGVIVLPKQEIGPNMGWISAFTDPEGNLLGLHQAPPAPRTSSRRPARRAESSRAKTRLARSKKPRRPTKARKARR